MVSWLSSLRVFTPENRNVRLGELAGQEAQPIARPELPSHRCLSPSVGRSPAVCKVADIFRGGLGVEDARTRMSPQDKEEP